MQCTGDSGPPSGGSDLPPLALLRKTRSFVEAFNLATSLVTHREKKEKFAPSNPQMALGTALQNKLVMLEQQLVTRPPATAIRRVSAQGDSQSPDMFARYVALSYDSKYAAQGYEACVTNMHSYGPETLVERNPNYFSGLNKTSPLWPRLANAWNRYAESYCAKINDPDMMQALYAKHLRANISTHDLEPVLKFLTSDRGKHWYTSERKAMLSLSTELAKIQSEIEAPLAKTYQDEQMRIYNDFHAEKPAVNGSITTPNN